MVIIRNTLWLVKVAPCVAETSPDVAMEFASDMIFLDTARLIKPAREIVQRLSDRYCVVMVSVILERSVPVQTIVPY